MLRTPVRPGRVLRGRVGAHAHAPGAPQQRAIAAAQGERQRLRPAALHGELHAPELALPPQGADLRTRVGDAEERDPAAAAPRVLRAGEGHEHGRRALEARAREPQRRARARARARRAGRARRAASPAATDGCVLEPVVAAGLGSATTGAGGGSSSSRIVAVASAVAEARRHRRGQPQLEALRGLVGAVVEDRDVDDRLRASRREDERARPRGVVLAGRRAGVGRRVAHRHLTAARRRQAHGERGLGAGRALGDRRAVADRQRRRRIVVVDRRDGLAVGDLGAGDQEAKRLVRLVERVGLDRDRDLLGLRRAEHRGAERARAARGDVVRRRRRRRVGSSGTPPSWTTTESRRRASA